ncbi:MAG: TolC family protein, partial [Planctomycetota bacterium]
LILPPVLLGGLVLFLFARGREEPATVGPLERPTTVETWTVEARSIVPRAIGYGVVEPARTWKSVAEASGRVVSIHPRLEVGEVLAEGTEILRIDPSEYELKVARLEADLQTTEAERDKLLVGVENTRASLEVAQQTLGLAERELERLRQLAATGSVSASTVDAQEQAVLRERSAVVEIENSLRSAQADEQVFNAKLASTEAQLAETRLQLARTVLTAPFDCRIGAVSVEQAQFVTSGATLLEADGVAVAEVGVDLSVERVRNLLRPEQRQQALLALDADAIWSRFGLEASVCLRGTRFEYRWPARFARVAGFLDAMTRTVTLVVAVDDAYAGAVAGERPPLPKGLFVEVELAGAPLDDRIVIPLSAVHEGQAYLIDDQSRLVVRPLEIDFVQFDEAVVAAGIQPGDRLVLTDVVPAIPGMLLAPAPDAR